MGQNTDTHSDIKTAAGHTRRCFHRQTLNDTIIQYFDESAATASSALMEWEAFKVVVRGVRIHMIGVTHTLRHKISQVENSLMHLETTAATDPTQLEELHSEQTKHSELLIDCIAWLVRHMTRRLIRKETK